MQKILFAIMLTAGLISQQCNAQMYVKVIRANDTVPIKGRIPVTYTGMIEECYEYKDAAGLHLFLATSTGDSKNFFGTCYTQNGNAWVQDWQIKDFSDYGVVMCDDCTKIVDIDHDGIYENIFVYIIRTEKPNNYIGDTYKMMLHYKNKKYAVRAYEPDFDDDTPTLMMDSSFNEVPPAVKAYVKKLFNDLAKTNNLKISFDRGN